MGFAEPTHLCPATLHCSAVPWREVQFRNQVFFALSLTNRARLIGLFSVCFDVLAAVRTTRRLRQRGLISRLHAGRGERVGWTYLSLDRARGYILTMVYELLRGHCHTCASRSAKEHSFEKSDTQQRLACIGANLLSLMRALSLSPKLFCGVDPVSWLEPLTFFFFFFFPLHLPFFLKGKSRQHGARI